MEVKKFLKCEVSLENIISFIIFFLYLRKLTPKNCLLAEHVAVIHSVGVATNPLFIKFKRCFGKKEELEKISGQKVIDSSNFSGRFSETNFREKLE